MFNTEITRRFTAMVCTIVMSATCVIGAVGPAHAGFAKSSAPTIVVA